MVMPRMFVRGRWSMSTALHAASSANVESNPPEMPTTTFPPVTAKRRASAVACIARICAHRNCRDALSDGMNGCLLTR